MTSPGLLDWDLLDVPVDDSAEPLDAGVDCSSDPLTTTQPGTTAPSEGTG